MSRATAKAKFDELKIELDTIGNATRKYEFLETVKKYVVKKLRKARADAKLEPDPVNVSEISDYEITYLGKTYKVDSATGAMTLKS